MTMTTADDWFDQPDMQAAALEALDANPVARTYAKGYQAGERNTARQVQPSGIRGRDVDAGSLAFYVRDLMDAAGYQYDPGRPLAEQARECCREIHDSWDKRREADRMLVVAVDRHAAETQRLTDLGDELRRQLTAALRIAEDPAVLTWRRSAATVPTVDEWNRLARERDDLRAELQDMRKIVMDDAMSIPDLAEARAAGPDLGNDPDGDLEGADYPPFPAGTP